jgi:hypothetical protein
MDSARMIPAMVPAYIRRDFLDSQKRRMRAVQAIETFAQVDAVPLTGPFAEDIAAAKRKAFRAALPVMGAVIMHSIKAEKKRERAEAARIGEERLRILLENSKRWREARLARHLPL